MDVAKIKVVTDGGPWVEHNMPCPICREKHAIMQLWDGNFLPCWSCQKDGYKTLKLSKFWRYVLKRFGVLQ